MFFVVLILSNVPIYKVNTLCGGCHYMARVLRGPETVDFFGISPTGAQIPVKKFGEGVVGSSGELGKITLR